MTDKPSRLAQITRALADGLEVDWADAETSALDAKERARIQRLRDLVETIEPSRLAALARALTDDSDWDAPVGDQETRLRPRALTDDSDWDAPALPTLSGKRSSWGPFTLRDKVGAGTFGTVYRAWEPQLEREVAVKLLHDVGQERADRLIDATKLVARIRHRNVVTVYDAARFDGQVGVWMEFIEGQTLKQILEESGPRNAMEATFFGLDLCHALAALHQLGIVHGDVKAGNVMRAIGGRTVLMDIGAKELLRDGVRRVAGTPLYMAPELLLIEAAPTVQSDLYSLGVLLFYMTTGQFPVNGPTFGELLDSHATQRRQRLRDVRPDLPAAFAVAVDIATAPSPVDRPANPGAMHVLLEQTFHSAVRHGSTAARLSSGKTFSRAARVFVERVVLKTAVLMKGKSGPDHSPIQEYKDRSAEVDLLLDHQALFVLSLIERFGPLGTTQLVGHTGWPLPLLAEVTGRLAGFGAVVRRDTPEVLLVSSVGTQALRTLGL